MTIPRHNISADEVSDLIDVRFSILCIYRLEKPIRAYPTEVTYLENPPTNNKFFLPVGRKLPSKCVSQFGSPVNLLLPLLPQRSLDLTVQLQKIKNNHSRYPYLTAFFRTNLCPSLPFFILYHMHLKNYYQHFF